MFKQNLDGVYFQQGINKHYISCTKSKPIQICSDSLGLIKTSSNLVMQSDKIGNMKTQQRSAVLPCCGFQSIVTSRVASYENADETNQLQRSITSVLAVPTGSRLNSVGQCALVANCKTIKQLLDRLETNLSKLLIKSFFCFSFA